MGDWTAQLRRRTDDGGFTLIELMVVVLIIAILIGIAVPTYLGAVDRANDRAVESNVLSAIKAVRVSGSDAGGYKTISFADLPLDEPQLSWVVGSADSTDAKTISVTIDNGNQVVTIAARHAGGDCFLIRDWFNAVPGTEFAVIPLSTGISCRGDSGSNGAVTWASGW